MAVATATSILLAVAVTATAVLLEVSVTATVVLLTVAVVSMMLVLVLKLFEVCTRGDQKVRGKVLLNRVAKNLSISMKIHRYKLPFIAS